MITCYNRLHTIVSHKTRARDEEMIDRIVCQIYNMIIQAGENHLFSVKWSCIDYIFDDVSSYEHRHIINAANRLRVLFPHTNIHHSNMKEITIDWY
jgi:hypothetical protein